MASSKSKLREVISSSVIRRSAIQEENERIEEIPSFAPYDEPKVYKSKKTKTFKCDVRYLSKTELKVLKYFCSIDCDDHGETIPVFLDQLSAVLSHPISTLKKTIQKLEFKNLIKRASYKSGRGGWTTYVISDETRAKPELNQS